jgi:sugar O-acyltransferase (sialic acid O-acetyltransferase NeuD family)
MDLILIGAGGHGKVVLDILQCEGKHRVVGFLDADASLHGSTVAGVAVLGGINQLLKLRSQKVRGAIVSIGDNRIRQQYAKEAADAGLELVQAIHPRAIVARSAKIGKNVVIAAGAVVCPDVVIGDSSIINTGAIVDHESVIGEAVHVCPAATLAGRVRVEDLAFVGMGAKIIQCLTLGARCVVGAGAVIRADVPPDCTAVGVPARIVKGFT